jgi:hypothetical protein
MSGFGLLDGIDGKRSDRIDTALDDIRANLRLR